MILLLFGVLLLIAVFLIILGFWSSEGVYSIIGFVFLFFLSVFVLMNGNLSYKTGYAENYVYATNLTGDLYQDYDGNNSLNLDVPVMSSKAVSYIYASFSDSTSRWFGFWLAIISVIGLVMALMDTSILKRGFPK